MSVDVKYTAKARATGGRDGAAEMLDGSMKVKLALPKEMGGSGDGNNPEQLFAAGYAACFLSALKATSSGGDYVKLPSDATVTAAVGVGPNSEGGFGLTVSLEVSMPGVDKAEAEKLVEAAHQVCPYSNATRGNIDVGLSVA